MVVKSKRSMRLTERHLAKLVRDISDPGGSVFAGRRIAVDADYDAAVTEILASAPPGEFWVFSYGSLIWNPAFDIAESRIAVARGWRRAFCLGWDYRFRGSAENPGLMLALDRGGQCTGKAFRLPTDALRSNLDRLIRREMSVVPTAFPARWISVATPEGPLRALTFAMDRNSGRYIRNLSIQQVADVLARACGFLGSMAEYLHSTVVHLEALGLRDNYLWTLQELVAERIELDHPDDWASADEGPTGMKVSNQSGTSAHVDAGRHRVK